MKSNIRLKVISTLLLACLSLQAIPAQCDDICFAPTIANKLYVDMDFAKKDDDDKTDRLDLCNKDRTLLETQNSLLEQKVTGLQADKEIYRAESEQFKSLYVAADQDRVKAENSAPSRLRWFAGGVVATIIAGIATAIAIK